MRFNNEIVNLHRQRRLPVTAMGLTTGAAATHSILVVSVVEHIVSHQYPLHGMRAHCFHATATR